MTTINAIVPVKRVFSVNTFWISTVPRRSEKAYNLGVMFFLPMTQKKWYPVARVKSDLSFVSDLHQFEKTQLFCAICLSMFFSSLVAPGKYIPSTRVAQRKRTQSDRNKYKQILWLLRCCISNCFCLVFKLVSQQVHSLYKSCWEKANKERQELTRLLVQRNTSWVS